MKKIEGNIVDIHERKIYPGVIVLEGEKIVSIDKNSMHYSHYITPGLVDAHVHIESSMLTPFEFSKLVIRKGTVAVVTDPHEIANVLGKSGIDFMVEDSHYSFVKTFFTIPSCVPSTPFDFSGENITADDVEKLFQTGKFIGLSEMMDVPGVLSKEENVIKKIHSARERGMCIDGHAPGLRGEKLQNYIDEGISTDHECTDLDEALEKINAGMKILIREGSAARNFNALKSLIKICPEKVMFCTDDSHPDELINRGHIDKMVRQAILEGFDLFDVLRIASLNAIEHYGINIGTLRVGEKADFVIWDNLSDFNVQSVYINGEEKYGKSNNLSIENGQRHYVINRLNKFERKAISEEDIKKSVDDKIICIGVTDGELITTKEIFPIKTPVLNFESDTERDILKIVYINRYTNASSPQVAYIHGVGIRYGAFATSITHDSHNIIAVGCTDMEIRQAVNAIVETGGGLSVVNKGKINVMPLPIGGIMSDRRGEEVAACWQEFTQELKGMGCLLQSPFMTLSFMALLVIPELKLGEKGLFEYSKFNFIS